jgi:choline dehydrogenase-like flavoprotein
MCIFGCPTDAKRSTNVSYIPRALSAGATLITGARVEKILVENGRAVGVQAGDVTVRAKAVVVACGALITPVLLQRNGIGTRSGQLGRNLSLHPSAGVGALFDESIRGWDAIPQGYAIYEFAEEGILFEGAFMPPDLGAASLPFFGQRLVEVVERYDRFACFGFMIEDTSRGRVRPGPGGRPLITYVCNDEDVAKLKRGVELLARCYFAAGARAVFPMVAGFDELHSPADLERFRATHVHARDFELTAYHPLGTCRMGVDPRRSVVNPDHEVHDLPGLFVTDGAAVPSSLGVNPQVTIMALATRAAERIAPRL